MPDAFTLLDREWAIAARSRAGLAALRRWQRHGVALGHPDLHSLLAAMRAGTDLDGRDRLVLELLRVGRDDADARRIVLQAVVPGLASVARLYSPRWGWEDTASMTVTAAVERIAAYPLTSARPAANIVRYAQHRLYLARRREVTRQNVQQVLPLPDVVLPAPPAEPSSSEQLLDVVGEAVSAGRISPDAGRVIVLYRVFDERSEDLAAARACSPGELRRRRKRAETRLADAAAVESREGWEVA